ncbi:MAG: queuosine precursor transporter [Pseudomonadota bacterium]
MQLNHTGKIQYKYFNLITVITTTCMLIAMLLPYKLVQLGPFIFPGGVLVFPLSYIFSDIITEVYGYTMARQLIWILILAMCLFASTIAISIHLPSPSTWHEQAAFDTVLGTNFRSFIGFTTGLLVSDFINVFIISKWKILTRGKYFWLRSIGSSAMGEAMFSIVTGLIVYVGVLSFHQFIHLTISVWLFKLIYTSIFTYPAYLIAKHLKRVEGVDVYDVNISYNPFRFAMNKPKEVTTVPLNN